MPPPSSLRNSTFSTNPKAKCKSQRFDPVGALVGRCLVGILLANILVLGIATKTIKKGVAVPFGYTKAEYQAWGVTVKDAWFKVA